MIAWLLVARAATLAVPGDYADLVDAVDAAAPGDVIEVGPGVWTGPFLVDQDLTIRAVDGPLTTVLQAFSTTQGTVVVAGAELRLEGVTLSCSPRAGLAVTDGVATVVDGRSSGCEDAPVAQTVGGIAATLVFERFDFASLPTADPAIDASGAQLELTDVTFTDPAAGSTPLISGTSGSWQLTDVAVLGVSRSAPLFLGTDITVDWTRVSVACSSAGHAVADLDVTSATLGPLMVWNTNTDPGGALLAIAATGSWELGFATLVGTGTQELVRADAGSGVVRNTAFAGSGIAVSAVAGTSVNGDFNLFDDGVAHAAGYAVAASIEGAASLSAAPVFEAHDPAGDCSGDLLAPSLDSPLVDAGDPGLFDRDGTRADIGATGGPEGFELLGGDRDLDGTPDIVDCGPEDPTRHPGATETPYDGVDQDCDGVDLDDVDGDGVVGSEAGGPDCDDADPAVRPEAEEDLGPVDRDCDGESDPTSPLRPVACTSGGASPSWLIVALAGGLLLVRRREGAP